MQQSDSIRHHRQAGRCAVRCCNLLGLHTKPDPISMLRFGWVRTCVVLTANMGHRLAGGNSSWCPELESGTTHGRCATRLLRTYRRRGHPGSCGGDGRAERVLHPEDVPETVQPADLLVP